jgi:hypothetical protein
MGRLARGVSRRPRAGLRSPSIARPSSAFAWCEPAPEARDACAPVVGCPRNGPSRRPHRRLRGRGRLGRDRSPRRRARGRRGRHQGPPAALPQRGGSGRHRRRARQRRGGPAGWPTTGRRTRRTRSPQPPGSPTRTPSRSSAARHATSSSPTSAWVAASAGCPTDASRSVPSAGTRRRARSTPPTAPGRRSCTRCMSRRSPAGVRFYEELFVTALAMEGEACTGLAGHRPRDRPRRGARRSRRRARDGRARACVVGAHQHPDQYRRRSRPRVPRGRSHPRLGAAPVPPHGAVPTGHLAERGVPRRRRLAHQRRGGALHGALFARQGARLPGRRDAGRADRDRGGTRGRRPQGGAALGPSPPGRSQDPGEAPGGSDASSSGSPGSTSPRTWCRFARPPTTRWAASRSTSRGGRCGRPGSPSRASSLRENARASACTARTASARTACSRPASWAGAPVAPSPPRR